MKCKLSLTRLLTVVVATVGFIGNPAYAAFCTYEVNMVLHNVGSSGNNEKYSDLISHGYIQTYGPKSEARDTLKACFNKYYSTTFGTYGKVKNGGLFSIKDHNECRASYPWVRSNSNGYHEPVDHWTSAEDARRHGLELLRGKPWGIYVLRPTLEVSGCSGGSVTGLYDWGVGTPPFLFPSQVDRYLSEL